MLFYVSEMIQDKVRLVSLVCFRFIFSAFSLWFVFNFELYSKKVKFRSMTAIDAYLLTKLSYSAKMYFEGFYL